MNWSRQVHCESAFCFIYLRTNKTPYLPFHWCAIYASSCSEEISSSCWRKENEKRIIERKKTGKNYCKTASFFSNNISLATQHMSKSFSVSYERTPIRSWLWVTGYFSMWSVITVGWTTHLKVSQKTVRKHRVKGMSFQVICKKRWWKDNTWFFCKKIYFYYMWQAIIYGCTLTQFSRNGLLIWVIFDK